MVDQFCANTWNGINRNLASTFKLEAWGGRKHCFNAVQQSKEKATDDHELNYECKRIKLK